METSPPSPRRTFRQELRRALIRFVVLAVVIGLLHLEDGRYGDAAREGITYALGYTAAWLGLDLVVDRALPRARRR